MRDYGKVSPQFWTGHTGKALKAAGAESVIVGLYLMTSPHANMIGLYYLPVMYMAHETGLGMEGASKGLQGCIEASFCTYDTASEYVFVHAMARYQVADRLKPDDKRCKGIDNELSKVPKSLLVKAFLEMYGERFHLSTAWDLEGASKPLRSQEQEQEQEQEKKQEKRAPSGADLLSDVSPQVAADFRKLRAAKKAAITQTAVDGIRREAAKAGLSLEAALAMCCERGWTGFKADWVAGAAGSPAPSVPGGGRRAL